MEPDIVALVCDTMPIVQTDVVDDDLSFLENVVVEVTIAHPVVAIDDDVGALAQVPHDKVFLVPSVILFCVPLLIWNTCPHQFFLKFSISRLLEMY